jgi:hypothetical protein
MKHATARALDELEPVLEELRRIDGLKERSRGVFYRGGRSFVHFHEDPMGFFADLPNTLRLPVNTPEECLAFLEAVRKQAITTTRSRRNGKG